MQLTEFTSAEITARDGTTLLVWIRDVLADSADHPVLCFGSTLDVSPARECVEAMIVTDDCIETALYMLRMEAEPQAFSRIEEQIFFTLARRSQAYREANRSPA